MEKLNCVVGKQYKYKEPWSSKKFWSGFNIVNPVWWSKTFNEVYRFLIVAGIIAIILVSFGYWQGMKRKPIILGGYKDFIAYLERNGEQHKLEVRDGHVFLDNQIVRASDVPQLKPYGIKIRPKLFAGISSIGNGEVGLGMELAHYFRWNLDVFGTQKAIYAGISYDVELADWMRNSSAGISFGKAWEDPNDNRFLFYWALKF